MLPRAREAGPTVGHREGRLSSKTKTQKLNAWDLLIGRVW